MWGATASASCSIWPLSLFQSTHPVWGATATHGVGDRLGEISIHAPRVGCDTGGGCLRSINSTNFNPRTPCGVRRHLAPPPLPCLRFQSTHPVWGATSAGSNPQARGRISIHAPRVGCDGFPRRCWTSRRISIHAPRVGCDNTIRKAIWIFF